MASASEIAALLSAQIAPLNQNISGLVSQVSTLQQSVSAIEAQAAQQAVAIGELAKHQQMQEARHLE